jgi:hypothetical protein
MSQRVSRAERRRRQRERGREAAERNVPAMSLDEALALVDAFFTPTPERA